MRLHDWMHCCPQGKEDSEIGQINANNGGQLSEDGAHFDGAFSGTI